jgi:hypothetical protein
LWSPDGGRIAVNSPQRIALSSFPEWLPESTWQINDYTTSLIAWSPNGEFLAVGGYIAGQRAEALFIVPTGATPTTYTDDQLGLAFDMPAGWVIDSAPGAVGHVMAPTEDRFDIVFTYSIIGEGDLDFALDEVKRGAFGPFVRAVEPVYLGEFDALRLELVPGEERPPVVWLMATPSGTSIGILSRHDLIQVEPVLATLRAIPTTE